MTKALTIGFLPLVDACLPILAHEQGFAEAEGLSLQLVKDMSWAAVLDRLLYGHSHAAHMLAPLAIATTLGRGRAAQPLAAPFVLGLNGNAITLRPDLAARVCSAGVLGDPRVVGSSFAAVAKLSAVSGKRLKLGVVHRHSSDNYMLRYWLAASGVRPDHDVEITTIAPSLCADALESGAVDGICFGEPWSSAAVERGAGVTVLASAQIWRRGVEKVLVVNEGLLAERREDIEALIRALIRAGRHFVDPANWDENSGILARPEYLDGSAPIIRRTIADKLLLARDGAQAHFADYMFQYREAANFPWVSQAEWLYTQMARWEGTGFVVEEACRAAQVFRPDIYRSALKGTDEPLPGASSKVEGSVRQTTVVGMQQGSMTMESNRFFDGGEFDPADMPGYLASRP
jgi:NitT/TauT family transport system ATP-binding protein